MNEDKASRYHRLRRRTAIVSVAFSVAALHLLLAGGASLYLRDAAMTLSQSGSSSASTVAAYVFLLTLGYQAVTLPFAFYQSFVLERRYGLSSEPLRAWLIDYLKAAAVAATLGLLAAETVYLTLRWSPRWWWFASALAFSVGLLLLARVTPTVLLPLFYRFRPLDRAALNQKLMTLSTRARVNVLGVYEWGLGQKTRRANAALVGTGSTRRILLSDTLLADYTDEEIEVILAHELGHHVHGDIGYALLLEAGVLTGSFAVAAVGLSALWKPLGLHGPADVAGLPVIIAAGALISFVLHPALNAVSRRNERRADEFALSLTRQPSAFMTAMRRLASQNLAEERPSRTTLWLFHTHPPLEQRMEAARRFDPAKVSSTSQVST